MIRGFEPSSALAVLAAAVHRWASSLYPVSVWLEAGEAELSAVGAPDDPPSQMAPIELEMLVAPALRLCDLRVIPDGRRFVEVMKAMHLLDAWHEPLDGGPAPAGLFPSHEEAWQRFLASGRFNSNPDVGLLVPHRCVEAPRGTGGVATAVPNAILHYTVLLPTWLPAGHPDSTRLHAMGRKVAIRYRPPSILSADPRPVRDAEPVIAIAPILQQETDARVARLGDPDRYGIEILAGRERLAYVIENAVNRDVELLFVPEMAVSEEDLERLASLLRRAAAAYRRTNGRLPRLRYLVAGCVATPTEEKAGRNYIIVMNLRGEIALRQHKLSRWNLNALHQYLYGLADGMDPERHEILEDIEPGDELWIADLEGIGRFATLICADMDYAEPGARIVAEVGIDWLHAPIMDKSIDWGWKEDGGFAPWVVDRAVKSALGGAGRVVVTNSMLFTHLINKVCVPGTAHPPYAQCGIGFMLHRDGLELKFAEAKVPISSAQTLLEQRDWAKGFVEFPPPP